MKISFIIPTYNRAQRIQDTLHCIEKSLKNAEVIDTEIIVIDNASKDNTFKILNEWKAHSTFSCIVQKELKLGVNNARNLGLQLATGDLLINIDDDCHLDLNYVKNILKHYKNDREPVMRFAAVHLGNQDDWPMTIKTYPYIQKWQISQPEKGYLRTGDIIGCSMAFPREIFDKIGNFDTIFSTKDVPGGNDTDYGIRAYLAGFAIEYTPDVIVKHYHGRNNSIAVENLVKKYCIGGGAIYAKFLFNHPHIMKKLSKVRPTINQRLPIDNSHDERFKQIDNYYKIYKSYYYLGFFRYYIATLKRLLGIGY